MKHMFIKVRQLWNWLWIGKVKVTPTVTTEDATHVDIDTYRTALAEGANTAKLLQASQAQCAGLEKKIAEWQNYAGGLKRSQEDLQAQLAEAQRLKEHWKAAAIAAQEDRARARKLRLVAFHDKYHYFHDVHLDVASGDQQGAVNAAWPIIRELNGKPGDIVQDEFGIWKLSVKMPIEEQRHQWKTPL